MSDAIVSHSLRIVQLNQAIHWAEHCYHEVNTLDRKDERWLVIVDSLYRSRDEVMSALLAESERLQPKPTPPPLPLVVTREE